MAGGQPHVTAPLIHLPFLTPLGQQAVPQTSVLLAVPSAWSSHSSLPQFKATSSEGPSLTITQSKATPLIPTQRSSPLSLLFFSLETHWLLDRKLYFIRSVHCVTSLLQPKLLGGVKPCPLHHSITSSKNSASREGRYSIDRLIKWTNYQVK